MIPDTMQTSEPLDLVAAYVKAYVKGSADGAIAEIGTPALPPAKEAPYRAASPKGFNWCIDRSAIGQTAVLTASTGNGLSHGVTVR